jgi:hypothetical protein
MRAAIALCLLLLLAAAPAASADSLLPPAGKILTGVASGDSLSDFTARTGKKPAVWQHWIRWGGNYEYTFQRAESTGTTLMLHLSTASGQNVAGVISPGEIARGEGDRYLVNLGRRLADHGGPVYLRLFGEMNNCDLAYSSHDCSGRRRDADHSPERFKDAWRRVVVVLRGGPVATVNVRLKALGMPALTAGPKDKPPVDLPDLPDLPGDLDDYLDEDRRVEVPVPAALPTPKVAFLWSPMTGGSPMIDALKPGVFWPGARYVDWVSTSFYSRYPNFHYLEPYYRQFADRYGKPFAFGEWAMWSSGDAGFVRRLFAWVRTHRRVRMMVYNQGNETAGPFRLRNFPAAQRALRQALRSPRFLGLSR